MKADHEKVSRLLKTARGQIEGILKMVEEDKYCIDISNQVMAAEAVLKKLLASGVSADEILEKLK